MFVVKATKLSCGSEMLHCNVDNIQQSCFHQGYLLVETTLLGVDYDNIYPDNTTRLLLLIAPNSSA